MFGFHFFYFFFFTPPSFFLLVIFFHLKLVTLRMFHNRYCLITSWFSLWKVIPTIISFKKSTYMGIYDNYFCTIICSIQFFNSEDLLSRNIMTVRGCPRAKSGRVWALSWIKIHLVHIIMHQYVNQDSDAEFGAP